MTTHEVLEKMIGKNSVLQVDSAMKVTGVINWTTATTKVLTGDAYILVERATGEQLHSPNLVMPKPLVIGLNVYVPDSKVVKMEKDEHVSKSKILIRDNYICQYCGEFGNTIDHIMPKSRGGQNTWGNLCAACQKCNGYKRDRTPEEAGFNVPVIPGHYMPPQRDVKLQTALYEFLKESV